MGTIQFLSMYVRTYSKETNHTESTAITYGGCSHATKATRCLLVTSESKRTEKEKRGKHMLYVQRAPSIECYNVELRKLYV